MGRLLSKSKVASATEMDSVKRMKKCGGRAFHVLMEAQQHYHNMHQFRVDSVRNMRYNFGDQWQDEVVVDGVKMREEEYIKQQGSVPLKNNLIRRLTNNVVGVYRGQSKEPTCIARDRDEQQLGETMSIVLQCNMQINKMSEILSKGFEEFLIKGLVVFRKYYGWDRGKLDCWTQNVPTSTVILDSNMRDIRGWDCTIIGQIHDVDFKTLSSKFAKTPSDYKRLSEIYKGASDISYVKDFFHQFGYDSGTIDYDFFTCTNPGLCRYIEVWRKETKPRYRCHDLNTGEIFKCDEEEYAELVDLPNMERIAMASALGMPADDVPLIEAEWFIDHYWYYYHLTPFGDILEEGETPYEHKEHPYVFKAYPFIDGQIHSFVSNVIDQQRYTNRLITLYDWIMRSSAKGVLIFPEECLPSGMDISAIADEWSRFNGVIQIKAKAGVPLPQQISTNATNIGINELLNMQLKFFEDISGVNGALQGKPGFSGMSASLNAQMQQAGTVSLLDLLESYSSFVVDGAYKDVKNIQQYYDERRRFAIAGRKGEVWYDPEQFSDIEFDLSIVESSATPAYRMQSNNLLIEIWKSGQITLEQFLEAGNFEFADDLLQNIRAQQERMEQGQAAGGIDPQLLQRAQAGADMNAVAQAEQMLGRPNM